MLKGDFRFEGTKIYCTPAPYYFTKRYGYLSHHIECVCVSVLVSVS